MDILKEAGWKVHLSLQEEAEEQYEEEFEDLLHFKTLQDAEVSIMRLDELLRRFRAHEERAAVERVANWFRIWLETPDAFFDWVDVRKQSPEFQAKFPDAESLE